MFRISIILALFCGVARADNLPLMGVGAGNPNTYTGPGNIVSGAQAWFGLRAYSAAVAAAGTQKVVNVRNTGTNETCDILIATSGNLGSTVTNCSGSSSGNAVSTFCSGTCAIPKWYDQSGNAADASQASAANQPTIAFSSCTSGSLPCGVFGGSAALDIAGMSATASPHTYTAVAIRTGANTSVGVMINITSGSSDHMYFNNSTNTVAVSESSTAATATASDAAWHTFVGVGNGASPNTLVNVDGTETTGSTTNNTAGTAGAIGADHTIGLFLTGKMPEAGVWAAAFNGTQRTNMCHNMFTYWSTPTSC